MMQELCYEYLTFALLNSDISFFENVDPNQLASDGASLSGFTLFSTLIENACLQL